MRGKETLYLITRQSRTIRQGDRIGSAPYHAFDDRNSIQNGFNVEILANVSETDSWNVPNYGGAGGGHLEFVHEDPYISEELTGSTDRVVASKPTAT